MKHTFFRRGASLLLALLFLLPLAACQSPDAGGVSVPNGMQDATGDGVGYHLFFPTGWTVDHSSGVTIATYSTARMTFAVVESDQTPAEYWDASRTERALKFADLHIDEEAGGVLFGGETALRYRFGGTYYNEVSYGVTQYIAKKGGRLFVLTYMAEEKDYESLSASPAAVAEHFLFTEDAEGSEKKKPTGTTEGAPNGMQEISRPEIHDFHFYVPIDWQPDLQNGTVSAYASEEDRTSVSLTSIYAVSAIPAYFESLEPSYRTLLADYRCTNRENPTMGKVGEEDSYTYEIEGTHAGVAYRVRQTLFLRGVYLYNFTYTARADQYDAHLAEADAILAALRF